MITLNIKNNKTRFIFYSLLLLITGIFLYSYSSLFLIFLLSYFIAYMFEPAVNYMEKFKIKRVMSVALIWISMIIVLFLIVFPVIFSILGDIAELPEKVSEYSKGFSEAFKNIEESFNNKENINNVIVRKIVSLMEYFNITQSKVLDYFLENFNKLLRFSGNFLKNNISKLVSSFVWVFTVPVIAFYFMLDFKDIISTLKNVEFFGKRKYRKIYIEIEREVSRFFRGQLLICIIIGLLMGTGFFIIGVDFPHLLGVIAGIANLIPYFGVIVSTLLAVLFSLLKFGFTAELFIVIVKILILVGVVQAIDGFLLSPKILSSTLDLSPVFVMFFLIAGGKYGGILGMFLAIPVLIVLKVLIKNIRIKKE